MQPGDIVTIARRHGAWIVDGRATNSTGKQWRVFGPGPLRVSVTVPEGVTELVKRPTFAAGISLKYEGQSAMINSEAGDFVILTYVRQHILKDGHRLTPNTGTAPVNKSEIVAENFQYFLNQE